MRRFSIAGRGLRLLAGLTFLAGAALAVSADTPMNHVSTGPVTPVWDDVTSTYDDYRPRGFTDRTRHAGVSPDGARLYTLRVGGTVSGVSGWSAVDGRPLWSRTADVSLPGAPIELAISPDDHVLVLFEFQERILVRAFNGLTGATDWETTLFEPASSDRVVPGSIDVSAEGIVAVTWEQFVQGTGTSYRMAFVGADGTPIQDNALSLSFPTALQDLVFSADGERAFALAQTRTANGTLALTIASARADGAAPWTRTWVNGAINVFGEFQAWGDTYPFALAVSPDGQQVVAAGYTQSNCEGTLLGEYRRLAVAFAVGGEQQWLYAPEALGGDPAAANPCTVGEDRFEDVAIASDGTVILSGPSQPVGPVAGGIYNVLTEALDPTGGSLLWTHRWADPSSGADPYLRLTPDGTTATVAASRLLQPDGCPPDSGLPVVEGLSVATGATVWTDIWADGCDFGAGVYQDAALSPDGSTFYGVVLRQGVRQFRTALDFDSAGAPADTTPPVFAAASDVTAEASESAGAYVTYTPPAAIDETDGAVAVECAPPPGSLFPLGDTAVACTAADAAGNTSTASFTVHVVDTTPPVIDPVSDVTREATGPSGAALGYVPPAATDAVDNVIPTTCDPPPGTIAAVDATVLVTCTATDSHGNASQATFSIHVVDTTMPAIDAVSDLNVPATGPAGAAVVYPVPGATDLVDGLLTAVCTPASGSPFVIGETAVTCTAADAHGNTAVATFVVRVYLLQTDLQVSLGPAAPGTPHVVGDVVDYVVSVHNNGADPVDVAITVDPQFHDQTGWGTIPPGAAANGVLFVDLGLVTPGDAADVPFQVRYDAFGTQSLEVRLAPETGYYLDTNPGDEQMVLNQIVDLPLDHAGLQIGVMGLPPELVPDLQRLAVFGVRVPAALVAGRPPGDLFVPSNLTPDGLVAGGSFLPSTDVATDASWFRPEGTVISGALALPGDQWIAGEMFVPQTDHWLAGTVTFFPACDADCKLGRRLLSRATATGRTDLLLADAGETTLTIGYAPSSSAAGSGLSAAAAGGATDGSVALCAGVFGARLGAGDSADFQCGSLTTDTLTGEIEVTLTDGTTLAIPAGATVHIEQQETDGWLVTVLAGGGVVASVGTDVFTLEEGGVLDTADPGGTGGANQPPTADAGGPYLGAVDTPIPLSGGASIDPDGDALTYAWSTADDAGLDAADTPTPVFQATAAGVYTAALQVCDPSGLCDSVETTIVVYDPSAGFVTGGGWILSPAGSCGPAAPEGVCASDPTGRANFGFVSKYKKGANVPDGQTAFVFQAGSLEFHSQAYEWLVVSGRDRAQFKGSGSINGVGGYQFMITAFDGAETGAVDGFRIKIWSADGVVYDNRAGADEALTQDNTLAISGGSIVIHTRR